MAQLTAAQRNALPDSDFAIVIVHPDGTKERDYPIQDPQHAANALARVAQHGTPEEKAKVRSKVCRRYPKLGACQAMAVGDVLNGRN